MTSSDPYTARSHREVFCSLDELATALEDWIKIRNATARPFKWTKTADQIPDRGCRYRSRTPDRDTSPLSPSRYPPSGAPESLVRVLARVADGAAGQFTPGTISVETLR